VEKGELDAGIVYRTDVVSAEGSVEGIEIPSQFNVTAEYPIAVLVSGSAPSAAVSLVEFVLSDEGRRILVSYGFGTP
jgi:molybdate transport system substrate-binding protein